MAIFDTYTRLTALARGDVLAPIKDISAGTAATQTKSITAEELLKYGAFSSKVRTVSASANVTLADLDPIFIDITPTAARDVTCPAKADDNHAYIIRNLSGTYTLTIKRSGGATITTVAAGETKLFIPSTINDFTTLTLASISDAELNALAGLTSAADSFPYFTGSGTAGLLVIVSAIRTLLTSADVATFRTNSGLAIGTNVQAYHARLAEIAGLTYAQGDVLYFNGTNIVKLGAGTSGQFLKTQGAAANPIWATIPGGGDMLAANNLSDLVSASTARTNLGALGSAGGTLTGAVNLGENASLELDAALSADGKYSGIVEAGTAGAALAFGDLCYLAVADSRWELVDANAAVTSFGKLGICVLAAAGDASATTMLLFGKVRADAAFPALTIGAPVFAATTAGDIQTTAPSGAADIIRIIGYGNTADELYFCPSNDYFEHT